MKSRIVITGTGVVSPIGTGSGGFWESLVYGSYGVNHISRFNTDALLCKKAALVTDFEIKDYVPYKGSSTFSRAAQYVCAAASVALREAELDPFTVDNNDIGVVLGTAFGSSRSMEAFDEECLRDGERFVDPMSFPKTVANSPAGCLSILIGAAGLNLTISTDFASGLGAVESAVGMLTDGRARIVFTGGYDELSHASLIEMHEAGLLSDSSEADGEDSVPLDRRRNGFFPGEGAGILVLERLEDALARQAPIVAELVGFGTTSWLNSSQAIHSQCRAMSEALGQANMGGQEIAYVSSSANGSIEGDRREGQAIERLFGERASQLPVTAVKSMIGECCGAAGAIQLIAAAYSTRHNVVTPTVGFREGEADSRLRRILPDKQEVDCQSVLVNSFSGEQINSSVVVKRYTN
jgi:3-oxoacyl-[acyl-carrier-protein] synthase II